eukprot:COSAG06_NODE_9995_length_1773_cov_0.859618_1_plen_53_part_10
MAIDRRGEASSVRHSSGLAEQQPAAARSHPSPSALSRRGAGEPVLRLETVEPR